MRSYSQKLTPEVTTSRDTQDEKAEMKKSLVVRVPLTGTLPFAWEKKAFPEDVETTAPLAGGPPVFFIQGRPRPPTGGEELVIGSHGVADVGPQAGPPKPGPLMGKCVARDLVMGAREECFTLQVTWQYCPESERKTRG